MNIFCHLLHIHSGKTGNLFSLWLCSLWWVQIVGHVLACRSHVFVCTLHHLIIIIVQTENIEHMKCLSDILSGVWVRLSIFSQLSILQYLGLCVFSSPVFLVMIEIICILCLIIIIKSEVWTITHCLGLGHETMVCAVCLSIFLIRNSKFFVYIYIYIYFFITAANRSLRYIHLKIWYWNSHT